MPATGEATLPNDQGAKVFEARGLTKVYDMGEVQVHALRGVDIDLYEGELAVLLGPSGSGKSTLLNILGGLDTVTSGHVIYHGKELTKATDRELTDFRRLHVGFVFQFYNLIPSLTARENVAVVTEIAKEPMDPADALTVVALGDRLSPAEKTLHRYVWSAGPHRVDATDGSMVLTDRRMELYANWFAQQVSASGSPPT